MKAWHVWYIERSKEALADIMQERNLLADVSDDKLIYTLERVIGNLKRVLKSIKEGGKW
jgi:hypothetical protein